MESEKVKEIKKALECCSVRGGDCDKCPFINQGNDCDLYLSMDALTLINELESENERLNECYKVKAYDKLRAENKQLKDRIAELEHKCDDCAGCTQWKCDCANIETQAVEQFAERLKEKFNDTEYRAKTKRKTISVEELKAQMNWILHEVVVKNIDETLKEFINEQG